MLEALSGATRLAFIVGDPIAQVKSPAGVTRRMAEKGANALVVPAHVGPADIDAFMGAIGCVQNVDAVVVTIPHKFAVARHCRKVSERARFLDAVNVVRRLPDGGWGGENYDGAGFVEGLRQAGCTLEGRRALLIGAGGAGSAIAFELLETGGISFLQIFDTDEKRCRRLVSRLAERFGGHKVQAGDPDPAGFNLVCNASPCGMKPDDPLPVDASRLEADAFVGDVITSPDPSPLVAAARERGLGTMTGAGMFAAQCELLADFVLAGDTSTFVDYTPAAEVV